MTTTAPVTTAPAADPIEEACSMWSEAHHAAAEGDDPSPAEWGEVVSALAKALVSAELPSPPSMHEFVAARLRDAMQQQERCLANRPYLFARR